MPNTVRHALHGVYAITDTPTPNTERLLADVSAAITGGASVIQYRDKGADRPRRREQAMALRECCRRGGAVLIINDDLELAGEVRAHGLHVGRGDATLSDARRELPDSTIVGVSCYNELARARSAVDDGASYVAFGSFFSTPIKPHAPRALPKLLTEAKQRLRVPVVAIGGITPANGAELIDAGADCLAVISGIFRQPDVVLATQRYAALFASRVEDPE